ncbi:MAG: TrbG/VirB9 family P-type conjugative transfer protein [Oligoflexia bacterium]|nr:TrbG/VirB9 family P-type conjugative transfer protein [Oligoflexia bacterium]
MNPLFLWILLLVFPFATEAAPPKVRRAAIAQDQIEAVRTALGIATIIQVPDRPNSVVVGDLDAFKVEYLDQAVTIKPLHGSAKSNLYIYTDWRRYNVQLVTGPEPAADYVVYLENPKETYKEAKASLVWTPIKRSLTNETLSLEVKRLGRSRDGILLIEFIIRSTKPEVLKAEWLWLTQSGVTRPIHLLFLSSMAIKPGEIVSGVMQVLRSDVSDADPLRLELRWKKMSFLTLPKVTAWK